MSQRTTRSAAQKAMDAMDTTTGGVEDVSKVAKEDGEFPSLSLSQSPSPSAQLAQQDLAPPLLPSLTAPIQNKS